MSGIRLWILFGIVPLLAAGTSSRGQDVAEQKAVTEQTDSPDTATPGLDPAFEVYADFSLLGPAIKAQDSGVLTDLALQTAAGESILSRPCRLIPGVELMTLAYEVSLDAADQESLARLSQGAKRAGYEELYAKMIAGGELASLSRGGPNSKTLTIDPSEVSVEQWDNYQTLTAHIRQLKHLGDVKGLTNLSEQKFDDYPQSLRESISQMLTAAIESLPADSTASVRTQALEVLATVGRSGDGMHAAAISGSGGTSHFSNRLRGQFIFHACLPDFHNVNEHMPGVEIVDLNGDSPLREVSLRPGDCLVTLDGMAITSIQQLERHFARTSVEYAKKGRVYTRRVYLDFGPQDLGAGAPPIIGNPSPIYTAPYIPGPPPVTSGPYVLGVDLGRHFPDLGVQVSRVHSGSAASGIIRDREWIVKVNGWSVSSKSDLINRVSNAADSNNGWVTLTVVDESLGSPRDERIRLSRSSGSGSIPNPPPVATGPYQLGVDLDSYNPIIKGVQVSNVHYGSQAYGRIAAGDWILKVNGWDVSGKSDLINRVRNAASSNGGLVTLTVVDRGLGAPRDEGIRLTRN